MLNSEAFPAHKARIAVQLLGPKFNVLSLIWTSKLLTVFPTSNGADKNLTIRFHSLALKQEFIKRHGRLGFTLNLEIGGLDDGGDVCFS